MPRRTLWVVIGLTGLAVTACNSARDIASTASTTTATIEVTSDLARAAVAFTGLPNTRSFGEPTEGRNPVLPREEIESVHGFPLGARLYISRHWDLLDRTGQGYDIRPDQIVLPVPLSGSDEILEAALAWLAEQPSCQP